jgi:hypothetical protein
MPVADVYEVVVSTPTAEVFVFCPQETLPLTGGLEEEILHEEMSLPKPSY